MIDIVKLMEAVENFGLMDESSIKFRTNPECKIIVRSKTGGGGHAGNPSQHGCSIKLMVKGIKSAVPLIIPEIPYEELDQVAAIKVQDSITELYRKTDNGKHYHADMCLQFAYDNQAAIVTLWNVDDEASPEGEMIKEFMQHQADATNYYKTKRKTWKTRKEYDEDMKELNDYIKKNTRKG